MSGKIKRLPSWTERHLTDEEKCEALASQLAEVRACLRAERQATSVTEQLLFEYELNNTKRNLSESNWSSVTTARKGLTVYHHLEDAKKEYGVRAAYQAAIEPSNILHLLTNVSFFKQWNWSIEQATLIETLNETSIIVHVILKSNPNSRLKPRDYVYVIRWDDQDNQINVHYESITHSDVPPSDDYVRGEIIQSSFRCTPMNSSKTRPRTLISYALRYKVASTNANETEYIDKIHELIAMSHGTGLIRLEKLALQQLMHAGSSTAKHSHEQPLRAFESPVTRPRRRSISDGRTRFEVQRFLQSARAADKSVANDAPAKLFKSRSNKRQE